MNSVEVEEQPKEQKFRSERGRLSFSSCEVTRPRLDRVPLFSTCSESFIEALSHQLELEVFVVGTEIMKQGEMGTTMFLLNFGEVDVLVNDVAVAQLSCGALFGEMATISKHASAGKRTATIRARTICHCWRIDRQSLLKILAVFPRDEMVLSTEADRRLQELQKKGLLPTDTRERSWSICEAKPLEDPLKRLRNKVLAIGKSRRLSKASSVTSEGVSQSRSLTPPTDEATTLESLPDDEADPLSTNTVALPSVMELPTRPSSPVEHVKLQTSHENLAIWAIGETSELKQVRDSAREFLAKREATPRVQRRFTRRKCKRGGNLRSLAYAAP